MREYTCWICTILQLQTYVQSSDLSDVQFIYLPLLMLMWYRSIDTIMQPPLDDLNVLYRECNMIVNGMEKVVHEKVLMCTGDTLGQHHFREYKEGIGAAFKKCHNCQCTFEQMQADFLEEAFTLCTKEMYSAQCH